MLELDEATRAQIQKPVFGRQNTPSQKPAPLRGHAPSFYWVDSGNHPGSNDSMRKLFNRRSEMARGRKPTTGRTVTPAGVTFEPGVLEYLEVLRDREERSRSWLINRMVKEHAANSGIDIAALASKQTPQMTS